MTILYRNLPIARPKPNAKEFIDIILGRVQSSRTPLVEYLVDEAVMRPIVTELLGRPWPVSDGSRESQKAWLDTFIDFWYRMGYDFVRFETGLPFAEKHLLARDTAQGTDRDRHWVDQHHGMITTWEEFESYPWPKVEEFDFFAFDYINSHLPEGMGLMSCHAGGPFEHLSQIMSIEGLWTALCEDPDLVQAISQKIGELMTPFYEHLLQLDRLIAVFPGDDMGFRTSTLVSPDSLREYAFPWHKKFASMAHQRGLPYFLHSCGNLLGIMDELIDDVKIDAKHSYEDVIIPVEEFHARFGSRIGVLGGVDINILSAGTPDDVRRRVRSLKEACGSKGRYAVGSGNSIPSYVPVENYLAMVDETLSPELA